MKSMENTINVKKDSVWVRIAKGLALCFLITIGGIVVFSILLTYTTISENTIGPVLIILTAISILIGTSISMIRVPKNGMVYGGIIGLIYILILYLLSSIVGTGFSLSLSSGIMIICAILAGAIGGIIGVNRK